MGLGATGVRHRGDRVRALESPTLSEAVREALIEALYGSGSDLLILPIQDVFGWNDRINQPATVSESNWTWRLPWPVDRLREARDAMDAATRLAEWATRHGRSP
jgi:4-alpha-glucanotransferase